MDNRKSVDVLFLDVSKAFDKVHHVRIFVGEVENGGH